jgi:hypothetical protein
MQVRSRYLPVSILVLGFVISVVLLAPRSEANNSPQDPPTPTTTSGQERFGRPDQQPAEPRPYERVITKEAK